MASKKPKIRTEKIGIRISPKLKYGLELVSNKKGLSLSESTVRALEAFLEADGIAATKAGKNQSLLDKLWSESPCERADLAKGSGYQTPSQDKLSCFIELMRLEISQMSRGINYSMKELYAFFDEHLEQIDALFDSPAAHKALAIKFLERIGAKYEIRVQDQAQEHLSF